MAGVEPASPAVHRQSRAQTPPPAPRPASVQVSPALQRQKSAEQSSPEARLGFIRKVHGIFIAQLAFTTAVSAKVTHDDNLRRWVLALDDELGEDFQFVLPLGLVIATLLLLYYLSAKKHDVPTNYYLLAACTVLISATFSFGLCLTDKHLHNEVDDLIVRMAVITLVNFVVLTAYTFRSNWDFSFLEQCLPVLSLGLIVPALLVDYFKCHALDAAATWLGSLFLTGRVIHETWKVSHLYGPEDYLPATIELNLIVMGLNVVFKAISPNHHLPPPLRQTIRPPDDRNEKRE